MKILKLLQIYKIGIRYSKTVLFISLCLTLLAFLIAKRLQIAVDMTAMAPRESKSVEALNEYKKYFGGTSHFIVTVEADHEPELVSQFIEEFVQQIEKHPLVVYVYYPRPFDYFKKRLWLYLDLNDLNEIERRIDQSLVLEKEGVSPVFNDLVDFADEEDRPDLTFKDIFKKYEEKSWNLLKENSENKLTVLHIKVKEEAQNINAARILISDFRKIEKEIKNHQAYDLVTVGYTGPLETTLEENDQILHEMFWVSLFVILVLVLIIWVYFRRFEAILLIGVPLIFAILWTGGIIYLILGHLNLMTSFAGAILAGLGSDYGIYLLSRYYSERELGKNFLSACRFTFENTGSATYASMLTTVGAFVALCFSDFRVFFEFGLFGALGVLLNYLAMVTVLPSLLVYVNRWRGENDLPFLAYRRHSIWKSGIFYKAPLLGIVIVFILCGLAALSIPQESKIVFQEDILVNKNLPGNRLYEKMSEAATRTLSPTILMVRNLEEERKLVKRLDSLLENTQGQGLAYKNVIGLSTFIPDQQFEKKEVLKRIERKFSRIRLFLKGKKDKLLDHFRDSIRANPPARENLPSEVKRLFESPQDNNLFAVYLFPAFSRLSAESLHKYHSEILALQEKIEFPFLAADGTFVYDDIVRLINQETPRGMILIIIFLMIVLLFINHSLKRMFIIMANLLGSLVLLSGLLYLVHIPLHVINISAIPIILGTGIDSFIHFAQRYDEDGLELALQEKIPAISVSNLTSMVGFAGLLFVSNPALQSIGWIAIFGLSLVTLVCAFVFTRCLVWESLQKKVVPQIGVRI